VLAELHAGPPRGYPGVNKHLTRSDSGTTGYILGVTLRCGAKSVTPVQEAEAPEPEQMTNATV
jgi:hypothetical protein